jgi:hypothetical protein
MATSGWRRLGGSRSTSIEVRIGGAIAALFFNDRGFVEPAKCYLLSKAVDRLEPFLPVLEPLVKGSPSVFVAGVTLNLLEVSPRPPHLPFLVTAARAWLDSYPNDGEFWVQYGVGRRVCTWIGEVRPQVAALRNAGAPIRSEINLILGALTNLGVAEARRLEEVLTSGLERET